MHRVVLLCLLCAIMFIGACAARKEQPQNEHRDNPMEMLEPEDDPWYRPSLESENDPFGL